jgi:hypothetical protein
MKLEEAIAQLEEAMKATPFFDLPEPHKVTAGGTERHDEWTAQEDGKSLECPVCKTRFNVKVRLLVIPARSNLREVRFYRPDFEARLQKGPRGSIDGDQWAVCSEECEKILQLRLDGIGEEQKRELDLLIESRKLAKAAWKLVGLKKRMKG